MNSGGSSDFTHTHTVSLLKQQLGHLQTHYFTLREKKTKQSESLGFPPKSFNAVPHDSCIFQRLHTHLCFLVAKKTKSHVSSLHIHSTGLKSLVLSEPSSSSESHLNNRTTPAAWYSFGRKMPAYRDNEREKWLHDPHSNTADIAPWKKKPHRAWLWYNTCEIQGLESRMW